MPSHDCKSLDHKLGMCSNVVHVCSCRAVTALATSHRAMAMMILPWNVAVPLPFVISKWYFENTRPIPRLRVAALSDLHLYRLWVEFQNLTNVYKMSQYQTEGLQQELDFLEYSNQQGPPWDPLQMPPGATPCAAPQALACGSIHITRFFLPFTTLVC